ncbi:cytokine receptor-like factor 3 [Mya arenaria]|uniref:cytokine receptor-like factor 3 n=1 Tax=Mya arenaria TaxID=6604 RepID=UPI0022E1F950|nr:cytokine receptor-like factor 3 [Mya arenaria]
MSTDELIQNVIDTLDTAHSQQMQLNQQLESLVHAKQQIEESSSNAKDSVRTYFDSVRESLYSALTKRMNQLLGEVDRLESSNLQPLLECEDMITTAMSAATSCMEKGKEVLASGPEDHVDDLLKFKDFALSKDLNIVPEVPNLYDVAFLDVVFQDGISRELGEVISQVGHVTDRPSVHVTEVEERPGALLVKWEELDDHIEAVQFRLQFCYGEVKASQAHRATFQNTYTGPNMHHLVKRLKVKQPYSFRVSCRGENEDQWSVWSVPRVASTSISHYEWDDSSEGYSTSNESKIATRTTGLTRALYSKTQCYRSGYPISFKILDSGEKSPLDGLGIAVTNDDINSMKREGAVFLACDGTVFIDGQEMKTRLPCLTRNSLVTIETEILPNGKVRASVQVGDKELTFDWKVGKQVTLGMIGGLGMSPLTESAPCFFFGMMFSHEDWKVSVE